MTGPVRIAYTAASGGHSCAVGEDGSLWIWGVNENGQLGDGTTIDKKLPVKIMDDVKMVATGSDHSLAIKRDGSLWAWGSNENGQLGNGGFLMQCTPEKIMDGVVALAAGGGSSFAIKKDSSLWGWGLNCFGQLGNGSVVNNNVPVKILDGVKEISTGGGHCLAVKSDSSLWAWGLNKDGQLGNADKTDTNKPIKIMDGVKSAAAGGSYSLAIKKDGSLWTWGGNRNGELGDGTNKSRNVPVKIMDEVKATSAGYLHVLAIKVDGSLWTWGNNSSGELGDGTMSNKNTSVKIMNEVKEISAGAACSYAIKVDGSLWGWGNNYRYQLGDGTNNMKNIPTELKHFSVSATEKQISLNKKDMNIKIGEFQYLTSSASPLDIMEENVIWTSSKPYVATVNMYGKVTGISEGTADISVASVYGKQAATCTVTVKGTTDKSKQTYNEEEVEYNAQKAVEDYEAAPFYTNKDAALSKELKKSAKIAIQAVLNPVIVTIFNERIDRQTEMIEDAKTNPPIIEQVDRYYDSSIKKAPNSDPAETINDFYTVFSPAKGDLPTTVSGQSGYGSRTVFTDYNGMGTLEFRFKGGADGGYYFEYKNGNHTYPFMYYRMGEFIPKQTGHIVLYVRGNNIHDTSDKVGAKIVIFNSTDICVDVVVQAIKKDEHNKLQIDDRVGKVKIYWQEDAKNAGSDEGKAPLIPVSGITLNKTNLSINEGQSENLAETVSPSNASNKNVIWNTSDSGVAIVDSRGKVTGICEGKVTITATTVDGNKIATCSVYVKAVIYQGLLGEYYQYFANTDDTELRCQNIDSSIDLNWSIGKPSLNEYLIKEKFKIIWNGFLKAPKTGTYTFYVEADDGIQMKVGTIGNSMGIDQWKDGGIKKSFDIDLIKGQSYPIYLAYYNHKKDAYIRLYWEIKSKEGDTKKEIVPGWAFYCKKGKNHVPNANDNIRKITDKEWDDYFGNKPLIYNDLLSYWSAKAAWDNYNYSRFSKSNDTRGKVLSDLGFSKEKVYAFDFVNNTETNLIFNEVHGIIGYKNINGSSKKIVAISFEGTDPKIWESSDIFTDLQADPVNWDTILNAKDLLYYNSLVNGKTPQAHSGFAKNVLTAWFGLGFDKDYKNYGRIQGIDKDGYGLASTDFNSKDTFYWITGHSLGGAEAELFTMLLVAKGVDPQNIICYGFASPPVGNESLYNKAKKLNVGQRIFKVVNQSDFIGNKAGVFSFTLSPNVVNIRETEPVNNDLLNGFLYHLNGYLPDLKFNAWKLTTLGEPSNINDIHYEGGGSGGGGGSGF